MKRSRLDHSKSRHLSRFQIPFKIRIIWKPTYFQPFENLTCPVFVSPLYSGLHCMYSFLGANGVTSPQRGGVIERRAEDGLGMETQRTFRNEPDKQRHATTHRWLAYSHGSRLGWFRSWQNLRTDLFARKKEESREMNACELNYYCICYRIWQ